MWLFTEESIINMNDVSSIDLVKTVDGDKQADAAIDNHGVFLCYQGKGSAEKCDKLLFEGNVEQCKTFINKMSQQMRSKDQQVIELDTIISQVRNPPKPRNRQSVPKPLLKL